MLIEFRVKNFRSFRDEQVLSLVASSDRSQRETHATATSQRAAPYVLNSAVIYGANASGKSNLIKALQYMRQVVVRSAVARPDQQFNRLQPFRLNSSSTSEPTEFEVTFLVDGVRYQYGFAITRERIVNEHLLVYKAAKPQRWFERRFDPAAEKDVYEYTGAGLKGAKNVWEGATRPNSLFVSMSVQLNSDALRPVFNWFAQQLVIVNEHTPLSKEISVRMLQADAPRKAITEFLRAAGISVADLVLESKQVEHSDWFTDPESGEQIEGSWKETIQEVKFQHVTAQGSARFDLEDESSGTRGLFSLAGPLLDITQAGKTLIVDELDTSLHTLLVQTLLRTFHQADTNPNGAQLVFTTHDTSLLSAYGLFRRDQIWFVEKDRDESSVLFSLTEFSPRKNEALERGYLEGRYGALPYLERLPTGVAH
jgi:uncharacterized protein